MANKVYKPVEDEYQLKRKAIEAGNESQWFYKRLGIFLNGKKEEELDSYMKEQREALRKKAVAGGELYPAAKPFYEVGDLSNDNLWKIFKEMPKGGLLHIHSAAALSTDEFLQLLSEWCKHPQEEKNIYPKIMVIVKDNSQEKKYIEGMLLFDYQCENLSDEIEYESLATFLEEKEDNRQWLKKNLSISTEENGSSVDIWKEFNMIFARVDNLYTNREFYLTYHKRFFEECIKDNISYVELRSGFQEFRDAAADGESGWTYADCHADYTAERHFYYKELTQKVDVLEPNTEFLQILLEAKEMVERKYGKIDFRVILCARRDLDPSKPAELEKLSKKVDAAITIKEKGDEKFQNLVIGFDFVSEEDRGQETKVYADKIIYRPVGTGYDPESSFKDDRPRIQHIPFFLHDGESSWKTDDNILDAIMISKHRIGHGFDLNHFPQAEKEIGADTQMDKLLEPVLEICPISNQLLRYYTDVRNHSAYELMKRGICCVLGNDDPMILGNGGLSYDFWMSYVGMELPLEAIKAMVYISYLYSKYSYRDGEDFAYDEVYTVFNTAWDQFVDEMWNKYVKK